MIYIKKGPFLFQLAKKKEFDLPRNHLRTLYISFQN